MVQDDRQLQIREMEEGEEFATWLRELAEQMGPEATSPDLAEEHHLVLTDEIGDWIGGLRWSLRGGVAQVLDVAVVPHERQRGHAHRLLAAFEQHAIEQGAHVFELWTDHEIEESLLTAIGWRRLMRREGYVSGHTWYLLEKRPSDA